jgi:AraC-like DNA-binding protein
MQRIEWIKRLADFIETALPSVCSMDELSHYVGISKAHMQRQFKLATGLSIGHYIRNRRLSRAAIDIANTDKSITDIAINYNFESQEAFDRAFRKLLGITPKSLKQQPSLANNLSLLPLTSKYLQLFPEIEKIIPQTVTIEPLQLHGVLQRYKRFQIDTQVEFDNNIKAMWEKFEQITEHWPVQDRRHFTLECRNTCSVNGDFTLMAMRTGETLAHPDLISFTLPQQQMLSFCLTSNSDTTEFLTYLYSVYLPKNGLHIDRLPILWESFENGDLHCNISVSKWKTLTPPKTLNYLDEQLFFLPSLRGQTRHKGIPFDKEQTVQRLEYLFGYWKSELANINIDNINEAKVLLIGDDLDKPFTPEFEFHSQLLTMTRNTHYDDDLVLPACSYLRALLTGTLTEISQSIEYIKYCAIPEMPFYSVHGYDILLEATPLLNKRYEIQLLLPVKKR